MVERQLLPIFPNLPATISPNKQTNHLEIQARQAKEPSLRRAATGATTGVEDSDGDSIPGQSRCAHCS